MLPPKEQMEQMRKQQNERFVNPETGDVTAVFGPPDFGNEDEDELEQEISEPTPTQRYDVEEEEYTSPWRGVQEESYVETASLRQDNNSFIDEDVIFPNGPLRTEVSSWKKQFEIDGHTVNLTEIGTEVFIWRTLNRVEYREIMAIPNTDPLQREEIICEVCVLFPYEYNFKSMSERKAGIPAILAEQIMKESGFVKIAPPVRL